MARVTTRTPPCLVASLAHDPFEALCHSYGVRRCDRRRDDQMALWRRGHAAVPQCVGALLGRSGGVLYVVSARRRRGVVVLWCCSAVTVWRCGGVVVCHAVAGQCGGGLVGGGVADGLPSAGAAV